MHSASLAAVQPPAIGDDFELLFRDVYPSVVRHAVRVLGNLGEAEEIASEAFLKLIREKRDIRDRVAWLRKCVLHLALDKLRSNGRRYRREQHALGFVEPGNPESELIVRQQQKRVRHVLSVLTSQDAVLLLARAEGASYEEAAELAGIRVTSTGKMLARAQRKFKKKYEELYGNE